MCEARLEVKARNGQVKCRAQVDLVTQRARAIVKATTHYKDPKIVLEASEELGEAMKGLDVRQLEEKDLLQTRGW